MRLISVCICFFVFQSVLAQEWKSFAYKTGDLLFQDLDCGALCDAIEAVTPSVNGKQFSHIGLVYVAGDSTYVIEAIGKDVHVSSLSVFLARQTDTLGNPKVVVGRLKPAFQKLNNAAIVYALKQIGTPYDDGFIYDNGKYYCSELIYDAYKNANDNKPFFHLYPMTFKNPANGKTFPAWKVYFKKLKQKIPEGKPGCNPASIALSNSVDIVASFF